MSELKDSKFYAKTRKFTYEKDLYSQMLLKQENVQDLCLMGLSHCRLQEGKSKLLFLSLISSPQYRLQRSSLFSAVKIVNITQEILE